MVSVKGPWSHSVKKMGKVAALEEGDQVRRWFGVGWGNRDGGK